MNIDTDLQWAFWDGIRGYEADKHDYLQGQLGNPNGPDAPNKKQYDPRVWLRAGEESFVARLEQAFGELHNVGHPRLTLAPAHPAPRRRWRCWVNSAPHLHRLSVDRPSDVVVGSYWPYIAIARRAGEGGRADVGQGSSAVISRRKVSTSARWRVRFIGGSALTMSHR